jgi:hypothetical protein
MGTLVVRAARARAEAKARRAALVDFQPAGILDRAKDAAI